MGLEIQSAFIVAAMDLKLVRLLRDAMRAADAAAGRPSGIGAGAAADPRSRHRIQPEPRIDGRRVIHPQPRIEPRTVVHVESRIVQPPAAPVEPEQPTRLESPIQPPWKILPWKIPVPPPAKIKVIQHRLDIVNKGSLIDFFM